MIIIIHILLGMATIALVAGIFHIFGYFVHRLLDLANKDIHPQLYIVTGFYSICILCCVILVLYIVGSELYIVGSGTLYLFSFL
jgi:hypothetical protein